jgi:F0F1-type ATP synthase assembly protein I
VLRHAGYGPETIAAVQTVDQKEAYYRVQSTLRGSNPLGAYLVVVSSAILAWLITKRTSRQVTLAAGLFLVATLAVLGHTYSRSAYIGAAVAGVVVCWLLLRTTKARQWLLAGMIALALVAAGSFAVLRDNDQFENTFFHTDETSQAADSSNEARAQALQQGIVDVAHEPLGRGPGTAGPASQYNLVPARIAENYYLQIGQEVGWIGLVLFIAILVMVGQALREQRKTAFGAMLLASLIGISLINLLSHAWTDDTLSLVWWGLAGIAIATPGILSTKDETG